MVVRGLVGASLTQDAPAYTLSPEPMTERPILDAQGRPRSVWSALGTLTLREHCDLVQLIWTDCTRREAAYVLADALLWEATQVARWEPRASGDGWLVWVQREGRARVEVYS